MAVTQPVYAIPAFAVAGQNTHISDHNTITNALTALHDTMYYIPPGGTTDQVLAKASNTNGDLKWTTGGGGSGTVTTVQNIPPTNGDVNLSTVFAALSHTSVLATTSVTGHVRLATYGELGLGTDTSKVPSVAVIKQYLDGLPGSGTVTSVQGQLPNNGNVDLTNIFSPEPHTHAAENITSGVLGISRNTAGSEIIVDKALSIYGAAGAWPTARPAGATIPILWIGSDEPLNGSGISMAIPGDRWLVI